MNRFRDQRQIQEFVNDILNQHESEDLEFKHASGGFPGSFWDTYSAFANTDGGTILLGIVEKNDGLYLDALSDEQIEKYKKDFWNSVNNKSTINCNLLRNDDVQIVEFNGYKFMLFYVPRATREQRPIYRTTNPYNGTFKRNYEGDYKCTEKEVQQMFADANSAKPADCRILPNYTLKDIDAESLQQYRQLVALSKGAHHPWLALEDLNLLEKLGGYRADRETGEKGFTIAGLLMFGKTESITDVVCVPDFFPDYQENFSENPDVRWTTRISPDGTWEANLFQFYRRILPRLQNILPNPFLLDGNQRKEETSAHIAVREAFINICIHADFSENASLLVKNDGKRFVFSNPGTMLVSRTQFFKGGQSVCRNKALQKMFTLIGVAEKAGSGGDKILKGWKDANWQTPYLDITNSPNTVNLYMPMVSLIDDVVKEHLVELFGEEVLHIEPNKLTTLVLSVTEDFVTNERLRYTLDLHKTDIGLMLKELCVSGYLVSEGYGRGTKYYLPNRKVDSLQPIKDDSLQPKDDSSQPKDDSSQPKDDSSQSRMKKEQLHNLILSIADDWISIDEIAQKVNKDFLYLKNRIIPKMLADGLIERIYPDTPTHPQQKYRRKS